VADHDGQSLEPVVKAGAGVRGDVFETGKKGENRVKDSRLLGGSTIWKEKENSESG